MPFVEYYFLQKKHTETAINEIELCGCNDNSLNIAKIENNGDAYLKALIKRVCDQKEKEEPAIPIAQIPVFIRDLNSDYTPVYLCPPKNYNNKISTFIIQPNIHSYIADIFHPPTI
jgi:hypothetical protein